VEVLAEGDISRSGSTLPCKEEIQNVQREMLLFEGTQNNLKLLYPAIDCLQFVRIRKSTLQKTSLLTSKITKE
jgi:hypothetical protein